MGVCVSVYDKSMFATFATHFSWVCVCVCVPAKHKNTDMDVLGCSLVFLSKCPIVMQMRKFKFSQSETLLLGALLDPNVLTLKVGGFEIFIRSCNATPR